MSVRKPTPIGRNKTSGDDKKRSFAVGGTHMARLNYYRGWRDKTHGNDTSNECMPSSVQMKDLPNFIPYKGVGGTKGEQDT